MNEKSQNGEYFGKCEAVISAYKRLDSIGLNRGASGNISMKINNGFLITPSGVNVEKMRLNDMVELNFEGVPLKGTNPSSEWRLHAEIYKGKKVLEPLCTLTLICVCVVLFARESSSISLYGGCGWRKGH